MTYEVIFSIEAVEDVLRIAMAEASKSLVLMASRRIQDALKSSPATEGELLSEGLYFIDRNPIRAFFTIDAQEMIVEIVHVKSL